MIYLDNAATTLRKPACVVDAVVYALTSVGNAGRGAGSAALGAARVLRECRERMAALLGCPRADHVAFAANATQALNCAIAGVVGPGEHVVTTVLEHNSVLRPLARLARERGVEVAYAGCDTWGRLDMDEFAKHICAGTKAVVVTHASNVTGNAVDVARVAALAHEVGAICIVDASQTAGVLPINMVAQGIDIVCFTGHKALTGPQGTGGLAVMPGVEVRPFYMGGTGVKSFEEMQPLDWPTRLEAGTANVHSLAGLNAALGYLAEHGGVEAAGAVEFTRARQLYEGVCAVPGVRVYGDWDLVCGRAAGDAAGAPGVVAGLCGDAAGAVPRPGIVALNIEGMDSAEVSDALECGWGIITRPGAHCAPRMHHALGTERQGVVRLSTSAATTEEEIAVAISAIRELAGA